MPESVYTVKTEIFHAPEHFFISSASCFTCWFYGDKSIDKGLPRHWTFASVLSFQHLTRVIYNTNIFYYQFKVMSAKSIKCFKMWEIGVFVSAQIIIKYINRNDAKANMWFIVIYILQCVIIQTRGTLEHHQTPDTHHLWTHKLDAASFHCRCGSDSGEGVRADGCEHLTILLLIVEPFVNWRKGGEKSIRVRKCWPYTWQVIILSLLSHTWTWNGIFCSKRRRLQRIQKDDKKMQTFLDAGRYSVLSAALPMIPFVRAE